MDFDKNIQEELEELAPLFSKIPKQSSPQQYAVPSDYFDKLSVSIFEQTVETDKSAVAPTSIPKTSWLEQSVLLLQSLLQPKYVISFATVLILGIVGVFLLQTTTSTPVTSLTLAEIDSYIENNIEDFEEELLVEYTVKDIEGDVSLNLDAADLEEYIEENILEDLDEETLEELL